MRSGRKKFHFKAPWIILSNFLGKIYIQRGLIRNFVVRDLKARYIGSFMGLFWSVIHPIVLLVSYSFVFMVIFKQKRDWRTWARTNFPLFLFCGILPWLFFQEALQRSSTILIDNANLVTKTVFPSEILPLTVLLAAFVNHLIGFAILLCIIFFTIGKVSFFILLVPVYFFLFMLFTLGVRMVYFQPECFCARCIPGAHGYFDVLVLVYSDFLYDQSIPAQVAVSGSFQSHSTGCVGIPGLSSSNANAQFEQLSRLRRGVPGDVCDRRPVFQKNEARICGYPLMPAIKVLHLSKKYRIYDRPGDKLRELIGLRPGKLHREFWALDDVSFELEPGHTLGIIGQNGSGKSTLLQILAGIMSQTLGDCFVSGKVSALLELGSGFNPEFTGRENVIHERRHPGPGLARNGEAFRRI